MKRARPRQARLSRDRVLVRRATINAGRLVVGKQDSPHQIAGGQIVNGITDSPGRFLAHDYASALDPIVARWHYIVVVVRVHVPAELELFEVAQASDGLRLALGFGERGQEHPRQDRDDGNDDEQLDEGESGGES